MPATVPQRHSRDAEARPHAAGMQYRREIDGLRAIAVVSVILFHAGIAPFTGGFVGVDVFFVISGFLISSLLIHEIDTGSFTFANFYERRARRILPALMFVAIAVLPFALVLLSPSDLRAFGITSIATIFFSSNIALYAQSGYFSVTAELNPLLHTWSLAVEEQFYILFPILLIVIMRMQRARLLHIFVAAALLSLALAQYGGYFGSLDPAKFTPFTFRYVPEWGFYLPHARAWELLMGSIVAYYRGRHAPMPTRMRRWPAECAGLLGLGLILFSVFAFDRTTPFPSIYALAPTAGTALIILYAQPGTWTYRLLASRVMVGIGLISYSLYLWHQPIFAFARIMSPASLGPAMLASLIALTFLLSWFSWRFVERPFRRKSEMSLRTLVLWAGSLSLVVIGIGAGAIATSGYLKLRLSPAQQRMLVTAAPSPKREECHTRGSDYRKPELACAFFVPHPSWATFGDSHVVELSYALAERLKPRGDGIKQLSFRACQPAFGQTGADDPCIRWTNEAARYVAASKTIKTVVVSYRIDKYLYGEHAEYYPGLPDLVLPSERAKAWASYIRLLRYFRDSGKNVILLLQPPELPRNIQDLIAKHDSPTILGVSRDWWNRRSAYVTAHLGDIPAGVTVIDPTPLLCDASQCFAARGGKSLYFDGHHLSVIGEEMVADEMLRRIDGKK